MSIKKRIKPGRIEPSTDGDAIVVHFITEITHIDEDGMPGHVEKAPDKREVPVGKVIQGLRMEDIPGFAQEIVEKCRYIPSSKQRHVEQILEKLHAAQLAGYPPADPPTPPQGTRKHHGGTHRNTSRGHWAASQSPDRTPVTLVARPVDLLPPATVDNIDEYADELYEEKMEMKAGGAQRLLRLCTEVRHLEAISDHSTLLGVLSRELRENAKRSHELAVAITGIFLCLAHFAQFHGILVQHQCNDVTMRVVEYESRRRTVLQKELKASQGKVVARGSQATNDEREKHEREERRYRVVLDRQDRLLQLCLLVLRNLAEDVQVERKLVGQRLCHFLIPLLGRNSEDLLISTLGFLHKLSVFEQNKDFLVQSTDALQRIAELVGHTSGDVSLLALRVCYNLSFDSRGRNAFATQTGLPGKLFAAVQQPAIRKVALKVLYHLSVERSLRATVAHRHPKCIQLAMQLLARCKEAREDPEVVALCINFAEDEACSAVMIETEVFSRVVLRAIQAEDPLLFKIIRHTSSHGSCQRRLLAVMAEDERGGARWLQELVRLAGSCSDRPDVLVEVLGTLAGLDSPSPEVPWPDLCEVGLLDVLHRLLIVGFAEDDVLLECIILASIIALDPECVPLIAASKIPFVLPDLLAEKHEDSDIVAQLLYAFRCLLLQEDTREVVLRETDAPEQIMDVLRDRSPAGDPHQQTLENMVEEVLDLILTVESLDGEDEHWSPRIKAFRFEYYNEEWCQKLRRQDVPAEKKAMPEAAAATTKASAGMRWTDVDGLADRCWDKKIRVKSLR